MARRSWCEMRRQQQHVRAGRPWPALECLPGRVGVEAGLGRGSQTRVFGAVRTGTCAPGAPRGPGAPEGPAHSCHRVEPGEGPLLREQSLLLWKHPAAFQRWGDVLGPLRFWHRRRGCPGPRGWAHGLQGRDPWAPALAALTGSPPTLPIGPGQGWGKQVPGRLPGTPVWYLLCGMGGSWDLSTRSGPVIFSGEVLGRLGGWGAVQGSDGMGTAAGPGQVRLPNSASSPGGRR